MRVVLDTNIFVSMALGGVLGKIYNGWRAEKFTVIVSDEIVSEYLDVLQRPKLHLPSQVIAAIISRIYLKAEFVTPAEQITVIEADPTDNKFLEAAVAGQAEMIVSGDRHVLALKNFREISICTASEFMTWLENA